MNDLDDVTLDDAAYTLPADAPPSALQTVITVILCFLCLVVGAVYLWRLAGNANPASAEPAEVGQPVGDSPEGSRYVS